MGGRGPAHPQIDSNLIHLNLIQSKGWQTLAIIMKSRILISVYIRKCVEVHAIEHTPAMVALHSTFDL